MRYLISIYKVYYARYLLAVAAAFCVFCGTMSCDPAFSDRPSNVTGPRILAVLSEPAETKPGDGVMYSALVVDVDGTHAAAPIAWGFCATPKTIAENDAVSPACLAPSGVTPITATAGSDAVSTTAPMTTCALFGPDMPPASGLRPRDPDPTGGYFLPVRARTDSDIAFGLARTTCDLANAPGDATLQFNAAYVANKNPHISGVFRVDAAGNESAFAAASASEAVHVRVRWPDADAEHYAYFDPASVNVQDRRESMRVSFYTTAGSFDLDASGRAEDDSESFTDDTWNAPARAGVAHAWLVLRDARGGIAFTSLDINVQ